MNIWNKVFLGIIIITAIVVVALASVEMKIRGTGLRYIASLTGKMEKTLADIGRIDEGTAPTKASVEKTQSERSFEELRNTVRERYYERGRAWFDCRIDRDNLEVRRLGGEPGLPQVEARVTITGPLAPSETGGEAEVVNPEHLKGIVYVFEESGEGQPGAFLGRFNVVSEPTPNPFFDDGGNQKTGYRVTLLTADPISTDETEQIFGACRSRWAIFLSPPVDRVAGIFDQLTEEDKRTIPAELLGKFQPRPVQALTAEEKDGVDPNVVDLWQRVREGMDDPEAEAAADFAAVLDWLYQRRSSVWRDIHVIGLDIADYKAAEVRVIAENEKLRADGDLELKRDAAMDIQRNAVKSLLEQYQEEINNILLRIEKLQTLNEAYVAKVREYQEKAVKEIEKQAAVAVRGAE